MGNKEKHSPYYNLIATFRDARECALCELESSYIHHYFESMLYENVNNPDLRKQLNDAGGFCHRHAHLLLSFQDALGIAILYNDRIAYLCHFLDEIKNSSGRSLHKRLETEQNGYDNCPACTFEQETRKDKIDTFLEWLDEEELKREFESGQGFCKKHLIAVLKQTDDEKASAYIIDVHRKKYAQLLAELEEFMRKNDYRFIKDGFGKEGNSWFRAVKVMVGLKDAF